MVYFMRLHRPYIELADAVSAPGGNTWVENIGRGELCRRHNLFYHPGRLPDIPYLRQAGFIIHHLVLPIDRA
jgi:hypothetical protein